jgi:hypothetical protein
MLFTILPLTLLMTIAQATIWTPEVLKKIAPEAASCDPASSKTYCLTIDAAAPVLSANFDKYKISNQFAQAAILSVIFFESEQLKYCTNLAHPTTQGTFNQMQMEFLVPYAASQSPSITGTGLALITSLCKNPAAALGSAVWYYQNKVPKDVQALLEKDGSDAAYDDFLTKGIHTNGIVAAPKRLEGYHNVLSGISATVASTTANSTSSTTYAPSNSTDTVVPSTLLKTRCKHK